jgi:predicted secreted hydrolase
MMGVSDWLEVRWETAAFASNSAGFDGYSAEFAAEAVELASNRVEIDADSAARNWLPRRLRLASGLGAMVFLLRAGNRKGRSCERPFFSLTLYYQNTNSEE